MSRKSYDEILLRPEWQRKRLEILDYAEFRCQLCGSKTRTLHVHHSYYIKGRKPWEYPNGSMIALCDKHHEWYSEIQKKEKQERLYGRNDAPAPSPEPTESIWEPRPDTPWGRILSTFQTERPLFVLWLEPCRMLPVGEDGKVVIVAPAGDRSARDVFTRPAMRAYLEEVVAREFSMPVTLTLTTEDEL